MDKMWELSVPEHPRFAKTSSRRCVPFSNDCLLCKEQEVTSLGCGLVESWIVLSFQITLLGIMHELWTIMEYGTGLVMNTLPLVPEANANS